MPEDLETRLQELQARIRRAEARCARAPGSVRLLAVAKGQPPASVRALAAAGQRAFGENYVQEARRKQAALSDLDLEWHYIGRVQSNKTREIAARFAWVHSVDRLRIAERLSAHRPEGMPALEVCVQVNVAGEATKAGVALDRLPQLARAVAALPRLRLRGIMAVPAPAATPDSNRPVFRALRAALEALQAEGLGVDTLSMGMSDDFEAAIAEGATIVRVGTALFGPRPAAQRRAIA